MNTPITTNAKLRTSCDELPKYVIDAEVAEQIEADLIRMKIERDNLQELLNYTRDVMQKMIQA